MVHLLTSLLLYHSLLVENKKSSAQIELSRAFLLSSVAEFGTSL